MTEYQPLCGTASFSPKSEKKMCSVHKSSHNAAAVMKSGNKTSYCVYTRLQGAVLSIVPTQEPVFNIVFLALDSRSV